MVHVLDGCRAKLDRAEEHLDALAAQAKEFFERDAYSLPTQFDEPDESTVVLFKEEREIPMEWGIVLGDAIHNARSSLDHLVYQLVISGGGTTHDAHQFPIVDKPHDWVRRVQKPPKGRRGLLDGVDPAHVASIQSLQPYVASTGLPHLALLRDFSNIDKHRLIHAARAVFTDSPAISAFLAVPSTISDVRALPPGAPIEDGAEIARFRVHTDLLFNDAQAVSRPPIWTPQGQVLQVVGHPTNSEVKVEAKLPVTTVYGAPGVAYTRGREFREAISDIRRIIESFAAALT